MRILAIDPGNVRSAAVLMDGLTVEDKWLIPNHELLQIVAFQDADHLAIECMQNYGMSAGRTIFDTATWAGRFIQAFCDGDDELFTQISRPEAKKHVTGRTTTKDKDVMAKLIERYGPTRKQAVGLKNSPGPLYGISNDLWAALAVGVTYQDLYAREFAA